MILEAGVWFSLARSPLPCSTIDHCSRYRRFLISWHVISDIHRRINRAVRRLFNLCELGRRHTTSVFEDDPASFRRRSGSESRLTKTSAISQYAAFWFSANERGLVVTDERCTSSVRFSFCLTS